MPYAGVLAYRAPGVALGPEPPGPRAARVSDRADLLRLRALGALGDGVLDTLVVLEAAVAVSLDGGMVDEDVRRAVVRGDEPVALVRVEPLHCSLSHCALLARRSSACTGAHSGLRRPPVLPRPGLEATAPAVRTSRAL